jgi:uncharacterized protein (DUF983 family)
MASLAQRFQAIFLQRCPKCLRGRVFAGGITMNEHCPVCGHRFEREQGYFLGAMYASYFLAIPVLGLLAWGVHLLLPEWRWEFAVVIALVPFLFLVPILFRYSRVIWMHIDPP